MIDDDLEIFEMIVTKHSTIDYVFHSGNDDNRFYVSRSTDVAS